MYSIVASVFISTSGNYIVGCVDQIGKADR